MSKSGNMHLDIQERLVHGDSPEKISVDLNIPITCVYAVQELEMRFEYEDDFSPFNTVNS